MKFVIFALVGAVVLLLTSADHHEHHEGDHEEESHDCPVGETWSDCHSGSCKELTCDIPSFGDRPCTADCQRGCICSTGYFRNGDTCVKREDCPEGSAARQHEGVSTDEHHGDD